MKAHSKITPEFMMDHYTSFFNLKEDPFVLTPDPKYLFLGKKHREVMSHLLYGIREDKGFMVVVGEVGTGKTTLCRAFINQLVKDQVEVGLIYNPAMTDQELLQAINREFEIPSDFASKGRLIDKLNEFLLQVNGQGRKVVLIIDEAQNLDPSVLEQIRLISNLETETGKLIQIILVGQPELERILSKEEMRQLDQRIVVRGLLGPLQAKETLEYIRHRLKIATNGPGDNEALFSDNACRTIHRRSKGTPRLINILADRSLLVAYAQGKGRIDKSIVKGAYQDLESSRYRPKSRPFALRWQTGLIFSFLVMILLGWFYQDALIPHRALPEKPSIPETGIPAPPVIIPPPPELKEKPPETTEQIINRIFYPLERLLQEENWRLALQSIHEMWKEDSPVPMGVPTGSLSEDGKLRLWEIFGSMNLLRSLNYPAIVELKRPGHDSGIYAVLEKLEEDQVVLGGANGEVIPLGIFENLWYGHAYVVWKDFEGLPRVIYPGSSSLAVTWLQHNLKVLDLYTGQLSGFYNQETKEAVVRFQREKNLFVDGIVGPQTMMMLYSLLKVYDRPTLVEHADKGIAYR